MAHTMPYDKQGLESTICAFFYRKHDTIADMPRPFKEYSSNVVRICGGNVPSMNITSKLRRTYVAFRHNVPAKPHCLAYAG